ncbi:CIR protein [Plasmodium chabaudi adami]|uniref:CIR protein n=1 Tax=Plasmodium chabaudi adami TaxID=5826 RepID=A0A1D3LCB7_PLACE|nr:CIR protein [Plasmodium chabaudi adami]
MLKDLCEAIDAIDIKISLDANDPNLNSDDYMALNKYCPFVNNGNEQKCKNYEEIIISAFMTFLVSFISSNGNGYLDSDNFAEYAILWLCYQLNQKTENGIRNLNEFYNNYINGIEKYINELENAETYNSCLNTINKKQYLMSMDIKEMSKIYEALKLLCKLYTECNGKNPNYPNCSQDAQDFVNEFKNLNDDCSITGNNSYRKILYTLSTDYDDFKNDFAEKCTGCKDMPTLPNIKTTQNSIECPAQIRVQDKGESPGQGSEAISSGSSVASKLIPALLVFAILVFLGVNYKYSLFGFDKQLKRIHSREKIKKIKKNVDHYM